MRCLRCGAGNEWIAGDKLTEYSKLSKKAREARKPQPPESLMGALHDDVEIKRPRKARAVKAARVRKP